MNRLSEEAWLFRDLNLEGKRAIANIIECCYTYSIVYCTLPNTYMYKYNTNLPFKRICFFL